MTKSFQELQFIGNIIETESNIKEKSYIETEKGIAKLYSLQDKLYVLEVAVSEEPKAATRFKKYFAYEISKDNLTLFLKEKNNQHIAPRNKQIVHKINMFDLQCIGTFKVGSTIDISTFSLDTSNQDEPLWECADYDKIIQHLNKNLNKNLN